MRVIGEPILCHGCFSFLPHGGEYVLYELGRVRCMSCYGFDKMESTQITEPISLVETECIPVFRLKKIKKLRKVKLIHESVNPSMEA